jgi:geranylgeranyl reductase family protein
VLIERSELPRYKRCGGGLLGLSRSTSGLTLSPLVRDDVSSATVSFQLGQAWSRTDNRPFLRMVMREEFDAALVEQAEWAGARLRTGTVVTGVDETAAMATLTVRGADPIRARYVIAADGSSSRLAAFAGVRIAQTDLGLEGEFPAPAGWAGRVWLDWGPVPGSYGWLFPKGDTVTVGVIGNRAHAPALRRYYAAAVAHLGLAAPLVEGGHHTRVRTVDSPLASPGGRVLPVGDAAGWLEPWTREGISFALRSGRLAGEAVAAGTPERYGPSAETVLGPELAAGREILRAYERAPLVFHRALGSALGWREFRNLLSGRASLAGLRERLPVRLVLAAIDRAAD